MTLEPNIGEHGTIFVTGRDAGANAIPAIVLVTEHYNLIARLLQRGIAVKLAVNVQADYDESDRMTANVIAEIPGTDPAVGSEVVMAGAHLDSWHSATGATDNADGAATVMEALRILKTLGVRPRRTIRIALWAGEEQGLLGSKAYVQQHLTGDAHAADRERLSVYFNFDNGFPPVTGFYLEGNQAAKPIMDAWLKPLADLGRHRDDAQGDWSDRPSVVQGRRPAGLPGGAELRQLRRAHAPHQRRFRRTHRAGRAEAGVGRRRDGPLPGVDARGKVSAVSFSKPVLALLEATKILGVRAGKEPHRFVGGLGRRCRGARLRALMERQAGRLVSRLRCGTNWRHPGRRAGSSCSRAKDAR